MYLSSTRYSDRYDTHVGVARGTARHGDSEPQETCVPLAVQAG
jgi:hypothetical protein